MGGVLEETEDRQQTITSHQWEGQASTYHEEGELACEKYDVDVVGFVVEDVVIFSHSQN